MDAGRLSDLRIAEDGGTVQVDLNRCREGEFILNAQNTPIEITAYQGRGTKGWAVASTADQPLRELVTVDAGEAFGGEWPERQVWEIVSGQGELRWHEPFRRVRVKEGDSYRFEPGERRLVAAATAMRIRITAVE